MPETVLGQFWDRRKLRVTGPERSQIYVLISLRVLHISSATFLHYCTLAGEEKDAIEVNLESSPMSVT